MPVYWHEGSSVSPVAPEGVTVVTSEHNTAALSQHYVGGVAPRVRQAGDADAQGSVPVSAGAAEGAQARPVVAKTDSGHGADTSVLDGHLEALRGIREALRTKFQSMPFGDLRGVWKDIHASIAECVYDAECQVCPCAATHWSIEGKFCASHAPDDTDHGPDDDAAYEEAVGK